MVLHSLISHASLFVFIRYFLFIFKKISYLHPSKHYELQDVAVKILMEQDFHAERFKEFLREVCLKE